MAEDVKQELKELKEWFDSGLITNKEVYEEAQINRTKRREILGLPPLQNATTSSGMFIFILFFSSLLVARRLFWQL